MCGPHAGPAPRASMGNCCGSCPGDPALLSPAQLPPHSAWQLPRWEHCLCVYWWGSSAVLWAELLCYSGWHTEEHHSCARSIACRQLSATRWHLLKMTHSDMRHGQTSVVIYQITIWKATYEITAVRKRPLPFLPSPWPFGGPPKCSLEQRNFSLLKLRVRLQLWSVFKGALENIIWCFRQSWPQRATFVQAPGFWSLLSFILQQGGIKGPFHLTDEKWRNWARRKWKTSFTSIGFVSQTLKNDIQMSAAHAESFRLTLDACIQTAESQSALTRILTPEVFVGLCLATVKSQPEPLIQHPGKGPGQLWEHRWRLFGCVTRRGGAWLHLS